MYARTVIIICTQFYQQDFKTEKIGLSVVSVVQIVYV